MPVTAPFSKTWDAVIDVFGERDLGIKTIDRSSGLIVPADYLIPESDRRFSYANCGKLLGSDIAPTVAHFNVIVRGDSSKSTVRVRAFYDHSKSMGLRGELQREAGDCSSSGEFESQLETAIAARAEGREPDRSTTSINACARRDHADVDGEDMTASIFLPAVGGDCTDRHCKYKYGAATMSKATAIGKCRTESSPGPEKPRRPVTITPGEFYYGSTRAGNAAIVRARPRSSSAVSSTIARRSPSWTETANRPDRNWHTDTPVETCFAFATAAKFSLIPFSC
jgi:hypothetical protein